MWDIYGETRPWGNPSRKDEAWWIFTHWKTYCPVLPDCPMPLPLESTQKVDSYVLLKEHSLKVCPSLKISERAKVSRPVEDWPQWWHPTAPQLQEGQLLRTRSWESRPGCEWGWENPVRMKRYTYAISDQVSESSLNAIESQTMTNVAVLLVFKNKKSSVFSPHSLCACISLISFQSDSANERSLSCLHCYCWNIPLWNKPLYLRIKNSFVQNGNINVFC